MQHGLIHKATDGKTRKEISVDLCFIDQRKAIGKIKRNYVWKSLKNRRIARRGMMNLLNP